MTALALAAAVAWSGSADAGFPSAATSTCPTTVFVGDGGAGCCFEVVVRDFTGTPVSGATVQVTFTGSLTFCPSQPHSGNTVAAVTNAQGIATFCICADILGSGTASISADGTPLCSGIPVQDCAPAFGVGVRVDLKTATNAHAVALADLDGNGGADLIVTNQGANTFSVFPGNGTGGFGPRVTFTVGNTPGSLAIGDLNSDGKQDVVTTNYFSNSLSVRLGNGAGGFTSAPDVAMGTNPGYVAAGDFDRDGRLDLVVAKGVLDKVTILIGNGDGTFAAGVDYTTADAPSAGQGAGVATGDLDDDGDLDLVVSCYGSNVVTTFLNDGFGVFGVRVDHAVGVNPNSVAISDLNGNATPDVAVANYTAGTVSILLDYSFATNLFASRTDFACGSTPATLIARDLNGDGKPDLAVGNDGNFTVAVLPGNGTGAFATSTFLATGQRPIGLTSGDVNRDGRVDLVVGFFDGYIWPSNPGSVSVFFGDNGGQFRVRSDVTVGDEPYGVAIDDVNHDGVADLAVANHLSGDVTVRLGTGGGAFAAGTSYSIGPQPSAVAIGDVNLDDNADLAVADLGSSKVWILLGDGAGGFGAATGFTTGTGPRAVAIVDFDLDEDLDLVTVNQGSNDISLLPGDGSGAFNTRTQYATGALPVALAVNHLNADSRPDVAVANFNGNTVSVLLNNGAGGFLAQTAYATATNPTSVAIGDLNLDGRRDLAVASGVGDVVSVLLAAGAAGNFAAKVDFATGDHPNGVAISDLNGDGRLDLATANSNANTLSVRLGNGGGIGGTSLMGFGPRSDAPVGTQPFAIATGDLNGDGRLDLAVANAGSDDVSVVLAYSKTSVALTTAPNPGVHGATIDLTAAVSTPQSGAGPPSGAVRFFDGATLIGSVPLSGGAARLSFSASAVGDRSITAVYLGDDEFLGSVSSPVTERILRGPVTKLLYPVKDNTLVEPIGAGDMSMGDFPWFIAGRTGANGKRRGLVRFDLSAIPPGANVSAVTLTMTCDRGHASNIALHRMLQDWGEGHSAPRPECPTCAGRASPATADDATWSRRFYQLGTGPTWTNPGGDGDYDPVASAITYVTPSTRTWSSPQLLIDVQGWVSNSATNHGWMIKGKESNNATSQRFWSRTGDFPPVLEVTYTLAGARGACCVGGDCDLLTADQCALAGGVYHGDGTNCAGNPCPQPTGACCDAIGDCATATAANCGTSGGAYQGDGTLCTPNPCSLVLTPYVDALPIPNPAVPVSGVAGGVATYDIAMTEFEQKMHRDLPPTRVWGYGGSVPGPTIEASTDNAVTVNWINDLRGADGALRTDHYLPVDMCLNGPNELGSAPRTVVHLHGGHVPPQYDGHPEATILPGQQTTYVYPNHQQATTLWYHDHAMGVTRLNVMMGLAGMYLIRDPVEGALGLPSGVFEMPLVIQDRSFNPDGSLKYESDGDPMWHDHFFGDKILVNGKVWPYLNVTKGKYRFRIVNASNSRIYKLTLSNGASLRLIGTDGGLMHRPIAFNRLTIAPAERVDVVIDFAPFTTGTEIILENDEGSVPEIMKFVVVEGAAFTNPLPPALRNITRIPASSAVQTRMFLLNKSPDACTGVRWTINGLPFETITEHPLINTTEIWSFANPTSDIHPMHMHLVQFQVLDRQHCTLVNGVLQTDGPRVAPDSSESGWKDTVRASGDSVVRVIARFEDYTGTYTYHCHILEHEDNEMMRQFVVDPAVTFSVVDPGLAAVTFSTASWGDYDGDDDLDAVIAGSGAGGPITRIYQNVGGGAFNDLAAGLPGVSRGSVAWGDYDKDGDLDLLLTGLNAGSTPISRLYRNDAGTFVDLAVMLPGVFTSSVAWGDYDVDGDLDFVLAGMDGSFTPITRVYQNTGGGTFVDAFAGLPGVSSGAVAWADHDLDGDLDLVVTGLDENTSPVAGIYENDGGTFVDIGAGLPGVSSSSVAWADYDNDGYPDLALAGNAGGTRITRLYHNDAGSFSPAPATLAGVGPAAVAWGDYDGDGDQDLVVTGSDGVSSVAKIYRYDSGSFEDIGAGLTGVSQGSCVAWGDYDKDGRLDLLLIGLEPAAAAAIAAPEVAITKLYHNLNAPPNSPPDAPTNLTATRQGGQVTFAWEAAHDSGLPRNGLTYNLRIGTSPGGSQIQSAMSAPGGFRRVAQTGNVGKKTSRTLTLPPLNYYWSVQAVDAGFAGSAFASEQFFDARTNVEEPPVQFALHSSVPNPFDGTTSIPFDLPRQERVRLEIYDLSGRRVRRLVNESRGPGRLTATWNGADDAGKRLHPGMYLVRLEAGTFRATGRTVKIR